MIQQFCVMKLWSHMIKKQKQCQQFILLAFLLITIALLIVVSISCYLIEYRAKYLFPFHFKNNKLWPSELGNYFVCKRFAVQTLL